MSSPETPDVSSQSGNDGSTPSTCGRVKWFNNKAGYGFITVSKGDHKNEDVFVHHSAIEVSQEQYRYLVQGEYVDFKLCEVNDQSHKWQAGEVKGIDNGKLMCETRFETRESRAPRKSPDEDSQRTRPPRDEGQAHYRVRTRGPGPREGEEWMLVRRKPSRQQTNTSPNREVLRTRHARGPYRDGE